MIFETSSAAPKIVELVKTKIEKKFGYRVPMVLRTSAATAEDHPW